MPLGEADVLGDEFEREVGLTAGLLESAVGVDDLAHVGRQEGGGAADQLEEVRVEASGVHGGSTWGGEGRQGDSVGVREGETSGQR